VKTLAKDTEGYVGADIESVCRESAMIMLRKDQEAKDVNSAAFKEALNKVRPSISKEIVENYEHLKEAFSSARAKNMKKESPDYFG